jgi:hypothetical protein
MNRFAGLMDSSDEDSGEEAQPTKVPQSKPKAKARGKGDSVVAIPGSGPAQVVPQKKEKFDPSKVVAAKQPAAKVAVAASREEWQPRTDVDPTEKRQANDGNAYTYIEFVAHYQSSADEKWDGADVAKIEVVEAVGDAAVAAAEGGATGEKKKKKKKNPYSEEEWAAWEKEQQADQKKQEAKLVSVDDYFNAKKGAAKQAARSEGWASVEKKTPKATAPSQSVGKSKNGQKTLNLAEFQSRDSSSTAFRSAPQKKGTSSGGYAQSGPHRIPAAPVSQPKNQPSKRQNQAPPPSLPGQQKKDGKASGSAFAALADSDSD